MGLKPGNAGISRSQPGPGSGESAGNKTRRSLNKKAWAEGELERRLFLALLALFIFTLGGHLYSGDGVASYGTAYSLVEGNGGALDNYFIDPRFSFPGRGGHLYSKYGAGQVLVEIPFVLLVKGLALVMPGLNADPVGRMLVSTLNGLVVALSALVIYRIGSFSGYRLRTSLGLSLLYSLGTMAWVYARLDFSEPLIALFYLLMARSLFKWRLTPGGPYRQLFWGGIWLSLAILIKSAAAIALFPVLGYLIIISVTAEGGLNGNRKIYIRPLIGKLFPPLAVLGLPLVFGLGLLLAYNFYRYGSITETGYGAIRDQFVPGSFYGGLYGFLFSPGKSIFLYSPGLILGLAGFKTALNSKQRAETMFGLVLALVYLLFYAYFWNWEGDWTWGPRYLLPVFPFIILWAAPLLEKFNLKVRRGFYLCLTASLGVNALGFLTQFDQYLIASYYSGSAEDWRFIPELSPLRGQLYMLASTIGRILGRPSLAVDYISWDPVRVQANRFFIPLQGYDDFDIWWLRPANSGNWLVAIVAGTFLGLLVYLSWNRFRRWYKILLEQEQI